MGVLLSRAHGACALALVATALVGCAGQRFRMRIDEPRGATLRVLDGPFAEGGEVAIPFEATFAPMGDWEAYRVELDLPAEVAQRYGGRSDITLYGKLHVYGATELARQSLVRLPIGDERIGSLVRGEVAEISAYVYDPNEIGQRTLAHIVIRAQRF